MLLLANGKLVSHHIRPLGAELATVTKCLFSSLQAVINIWKWSNFSIYSFLSDYAYFLIHSKENLTTPPIIYSWIVWVTIMESSMHFNNHCFPEQSTSKIERQVKPSIKQGMPVCCCSLWAKREGWQNKVCAPIIWVRFIYPQWTTWMISMEMEHRTSIINMLIFYFKMVIFLNIITVNNLIITGGLNYWMTNRNL